MGKSFHATRWANALSEKGFKITYITVHKIVRPLSSNIEQIYIGGLGKLSYLTCITEVRRIVKK